ncbi:MAG TPA: phage Gp37/Gp68 family protein [Candidatus Angelobacter sp.]|nr:phage Gp37/Gp68 family protein [Candidatus Angelobacter sp.]
MADGSHIEWTEATWNPVTGCTKISQGCKNCYAERLAKRLQRMGVPRYRNGFKTALHPEVLELPKTWKKPRLIFTNSMSDLFHKDVPEEYIFRVFGTMRACPQHTFQVLTKRSSRLAAISTKLSWPANVWMGVSVEDARVLHRIEDLRVVPAAVRFLSLEPLIGSVGKLDLNGIHWVIVGGESGPRARRMDIEWVEGIFTQCRAASVPFFFKQWGGVRKDLTGRLLHERTYDEMPIQLAS